MILICRLINEGLISIMTGAKPKIILHAFLLIFLFFGCSIHNPNLIALHKDKSFDHDRLVEGVLGICGIISIDHRYDKGERDNFATLLQEVLREKKHDLVIAPVRQVIGKTGKITYDEIMTEYKEYPASVLESLQKIDFVENHFRYLLLGSIDLNEIREEQYKEVRPEVDSDTTLINTDVNITDVNIDEEETLEKEVLSVFKTTRTIRMSFHIYDIRNASLVWSCTLEDSASNSRSIVLGKKSGAVKEFAQSLSVGVIQGLYGPMLQPQAPKFETLLKRVFISFVDQLP